MNILRRTTLSAAMFCASFGLLTHASFAADKLRILTWADYVPKDVAEQFTKETGIAVELTLSNNEEMISKLRAPVVRASIWYNQARTESRAQRQSLAFINR